MAICGLFTLSPPGLCRLATEEGQARLTSCSGNQVGSIYDLYFYDERSASCNGDEILGSLKHDRTMLSSLKALIRPHGKCL